MKLYQTEAGTFCGTQSIARKTNLNEGGKPGGWKSVSVPTDKPGLINYLNSKVAPTEAVAPSATAPKPVKHDPTSDRYRVYVNGTFATIVFADDIEAAQEKARSLPIEVLVDRSY